MIVYYLAAFFLLLLCVGLVRDRRRFSNAVFLGLGMSFLTLGLLDEVDERHTWYFDMLTVLVLLLPTVGGLVLAGFLIANGLKMIRKEGRSLATMLSLLAGLGIIALVGLMVAAVSVKSTPLALGVGSLLLVVGYVAFLFGCFVVYAFLYGRMYVRRQVDFVVVLGSGLIDGQTVPPLLASRLKRGRAVYEAQVARGNSPVLITSGGKGSDEKLPEAEAMADYLRGAGFTGTIVREEESRTTEENMEFSRKIMETAKPGYRCVVVTNNFHAFRAAVYARRAGVRGHVVGSPTAAYYWPSATLREFAAIFMAYKAVNFAACALLALVVPVLWLLGSE